MDQAIPDWSFNAAHRRRGYTFQRYNEAQARLLEEGWARRQAVLVDETIVLDSELDGHAVTAAPQFIVGLTTTTATATNTTITHEVDLATMTQRNLQTGFLRDVRRIDRATGSEHGGPGGVQTMLAASMAASGTKRHKTGSASASPAAAAPGALAAPTASDPSTGECQICYEAPVPLVPAADGRCCAHEPKFCKACLAKNIEAEVYAKGSSFEIGCPEPACTATLEHKDVHRLATTKVFEYFDKQQTVRFLRSLAGFQWCKNSSCGSGQETVDGERHPIVTCHGCKARSCFVHDAPWHEGMTCQQYDAKLNDDENDAATRHYYQSNTKPCPKCQQAIQKNSGCDHMTCRPPLGCGHEFCWRCTADYEQILRRGNQHHKPTCTYYAPYDSDSDNDED